MLGNVGGILKIAGTQTGSVNNFAGTKKHKKCHFQPPFYVFAVGKVLNTQSWFPQFSRSLHSPRNPYPQEPTQHHEHQLGFQELDWGQAGAFRHTDTLTDWCAGDGGGMLGEFDASQ